MQMVVVLMDVVPMAVANCKRKSLFYIGSFLKLLSLLTLLLKVSLILHEIGHFITAKLLGYKNVLLHIRWSYYKVTFDKHNYSKIKDFSITIMGPLIQFVFFILLSNRSSKSVSLVSKFHMLSVLDNLKINKTKGTDGYYLSKLIKNNNIIYYKLVINLSRIFFILDIIRSLKGNKIKGRYLVLLIFFITKRSI